MKKAFLVILALVMALTLVIGSVSTVSAAPAAKSPSLLVSVSKVTVNSDNTVKIDYKLRWANFPPNPPTPDGNNTFDVYIYKVTTTGSTALDADMWVDGDTSGTYNGSFDPTPYLQKGDKFYLYCVNGSLRTVEYTSKTYTVR